MSRALFCESFISCSIHRAEHERLLSPKPGRGYPAHVTSVSRGRYRHPDTAINDRTDSGKSRTYHRAARTLEAAALRDDADWQERLESGGATAALFFAAAAL